MPIVTEGDVIMSKKHIFVLLLLLVTTAGCMLDRQQTPSVTTAPPYWQSQNQLAQSQVEDARAFHERESGALSEEMNVFRNREMERLAAAGKELEKERDRAEKPPKPAEPAPVPAQREKWSWTNLFKKKNKADVQLVSEVSVDVRQDGNYRGNER